MTRPADHLQKIELLLGLVALAVAWASKTATKLIGSGKMKREKHGYFAKSFFRIGLDHIRKMLRSDPNAAVSPWLLIPPVITRVV